MHRLRSAVLLSVLVLCCLGVQSAFAADAISVNVGNDPTEDVALAVTATWTASSAGWIGVTVKPAGGQGCGTTYAADESNSSEVMDWFVDPTGSLSANWTFDDPGSYILCGYLQQSSSSPTARATTGPVTVTVRSANASVTIKVPPRVDLGKTFALSFPVVAELERQLYVTMQPAGGRACEATFALNEGQSTSVVDGGDVQGSQTVQSTYTAPTTKGTYLLCAYVQEGRDDPSPEATASTQFLVGPDPCVSARRALRTAKRTVASAEAAVKRYRRAWKFNAGRGNHAAAVLAHSRYVSAIHRRAKARAKLADKQASVTHNCAGATR